MTSFSHFSSEGGVVKRSVLADQKWSKEKSDSDTNTFYSDEVTKVQSVGESLPVHSHFKISK